MNFQNHDVLFIQWSCWKLTSISFQEIIINNEDSGSRINHAEKFKANQQRNSKPISREIQSNRHKHSRIKQRNQKKPTSELLWRCNLDKGSTGSPSLNPIWFWGKSGARSGRSDCLELSPWSTCCGSVIGSDGLKIGRQMKK